MVLNHTEWLALAALAMLIGINVFSCACALQIGNDTEKDVYTAATPSIQPSVTVNVQQANVTTRGRQSRSKDAERKAADARRAREYRARKKSHAIASQPL